MGIELISGLYTIVQELPFSYFFRTARTRQGEENVFYRTHNAKLKQNLLEDSSPQVYRNFFLVSVTKTQSLHPRHTWGRIKFRIM